MGSKNAWVNHSRMERIPCRLHHLYFHCCPIPSPWSFLSLPTRLQGIHCVGISHHCCNHLVDLLFIFRWYKGGLKESTVASLEKRQRKSEAIQTLPDDMEMLKAEVARLREHTGLPEPSP